MKIINRKFHRDYEDIERFEAGIVLTGPEVKSIRQGKLKLDDAYIKLLGEEPYLVNAHIYPYQFTKIDEQEPERSRKILLKKKELQRIRTKVRGSAGLTLVPVACYEKGRLLKLEIALAKGRTDLAKRKREKARDVSRSQKREAKEYTKR